jgi:hypothetical protein
MSDLSLAQHTGLAFLLSQHNSDNAAHEASKVEVVVVRNAEPKSKKGASTPEARKGEVAAPIHQGPKTFGVTLPERNTLDAKSFLLACRDAGKRRNDKGIFFTDPKMVREDLIKAIHAYCGYDLHGNFGSQESEARAKAQREIRGFKATGPTREELKAAARSATGFVHGMPDHKARHLQNLLGRETAAVDAMLAHEKDSRDPQRSAADRVLSAGLAEVERERVAAIRADIAAFR